MDRKDVAVLINTCPKYFYLLEACFGLLRRYGSCLGWPVYLATEYPNDLTIQKVCGKYNVQIIELFEADSAFLQSRAKAVSLLPPEIKYIFPLQEDFLLERPGVNQGALTRALNLFDENPQIASFRLMPCPGSASHDIVWGEWNKLSSDDLQFSYQATLWRRELYLDYMNCLIREGQRLHPDMDYCSAEWNSYCVQTNPAETFAGLLMLKRIAPSVVHLCWPRKASWANAVYWCPWPYRPTAIVQGVLQPWARELMTREGFMLLNGV